jgi:hypothetical protein
MSRPKKTSYDIGKVHFEINDAGDVSACKAVEGGLIEGPYFPVEILAKAATKIAAILKAKETRIRKGKRKSASKAGGKRTSKKLKQLHLSLEAAAPAEAPSAPDVHQEELPEGKDGFEG